MLQWETSPQDQLVIALERNLHMLENSLHQKHDVDTRKSAKVSSLLVTTGILSSFYLVQEPTLAETLVQYLLLGLFLPLKIWIFFRSIRVKDRVRLIACHLGIHLCIRLHRCKHGEFYPVCWGLVLDGAANTIVFRKCL